MTETVDRLDLPASARFDAVLYPNCSLGSTGFALLMGGIVLVSGLIGAGLALAGAWPVTGFLGLDVVLLYLAFRWNYRQSRRVDMIKLDDSGLAVRRLLPGEKEQVWQFETAWVQIVNDERQLVLRSHGQTLAIGAFLTADERRALAQALNSAIRSYRENLMVRPVGPDDPVTG